MTARKRAHSGTRAKLTLWSSDLAPSTYRCRFSDWQVRERMLQLMGTDLVRITDRDFMARLKDRLYTIYREKVCERIAKRKEWEENREKKLVLEGKLPLEQSPPSLYEHPVFRSLNKIEALRAARLVERDMLKRKRKVRKFDYSVLKSAPEGVGAEAGVRGRLAGVDTLPASMDQVDRQRDYCFRLIGSEIEQRLLYVPEQYEKIKYEAPQIKVLRSITGVNEMYALAEDILRKRGQEE